MRKLIDKIEKRVDEMYAIGAGGLEKIGTGKLRIQASTIYPMGASTSPNSIFVIRVADGKIYYRTYPFAGGKERFIDARSGEHLIMTALKNEVQSLKQGLAGSLKSKWMKEQLSRYQDLLANKAVKPDDLRDWDEFTAIVVAADDGNLEALWRGADAYGTPGIQSQGGRDVMSIELYRKALVDLKKDKRFEVLSVSKGHR